MRYQIYKFHKGLTIPKLKTVEGSYLNKDDAWRDLTRVCLNNPGQYIIVDMTTGEIVAIGKDKKVKVL